jgi:hypothetical protein
MIERGLERSKDFSWKHHVGKIISLAEALIQEKTAPLLA